MSEVLRAGPFSDERVRRLINRRFVPFTFDLMRDGALFDKAAKKFLVKKRPEFGGRVISNEPLMIYTPDGKNLGETIHYASTKTVLKMLRKALRKHPKYDEPSEREKELTNPIDKARALIDRLKYDQARKLLTDFLTEGVKRGPAFTAHYMLAHMARWKRDWPEMERWLMLIQDEDGWRDEVRMERAYRLWHEQEFEKLEKHLKDFPKVSRRYREARYYEGLALYHQKKTSDALRVWRGTIKSCNEDPWVYRADWAYTATKQRGKGLFSMSTGTSPLGRIGYMGSPNPDLRPRW